MPRRTKIKRIGADSVKKHTFSVVVARKWHGFAIKLFPHHKETRSL